MRTIHRKDKVKGKEPASGAYKPSAKPDINGWREVHCYGGEFVQVRILNGGYHMEQLYGGGFVLRDEDRRPQLARGFPMNHTADMLAQAIALREAVQAAAQLGEDKLVFYSTSESLVSCISRRDLSEMSMEVAHNVQLVHFWAAWIPNAAFGHKPAGDMKGVQSVARTAARSAQHLQWDRAAIEEMGRNI